MPDALNIPGKKNTIKSWSISGTPLTIQTITLNNIFTGLILLIVKREINNPNGREKISVKINNKQVTPKPSKRLWVT